MNNLEGLNDRQREAVLATEGPVLVVAGAGAGKTKTITSRIVRLMENGVRGDSILAVTFTNKAGNEMRERVFLSIEKNPNLKNQTIPCIKTFHSLGVLIIKENANMLGLSKYFTILDKSDSKKIVKNILEKLDIEPKEFLDKTISFISNQKSLGINFRDYEEKESRSFESDLYKRVWRLYEEQKRKENSLDFDDLLIKSLELLEKNKDVKERYQDRWQYIHIDEYQDTNKTQNSLANILAEKNKNIFVVGDTDQNIYSWRGADIKNMLHFEKVYPNAKVIMLEQNYRSTKTILNVANKVINKNQIRIPKNLFTDNTIGEKISIFEAFNEGDEAYFVALKIKELVNDNQDLNSIAVLYRANFQSRILEEAFLAYNIPYQMLGTKFFERKEVKDVLSYIKLSLNKESLTDFIRVVNTPTRGIGKTTIDKIINEGEDGLPAKTIEKLNNFRSLIEKIKEFGQKNKVSELIKFVIEISGIKKDFEESKKEEDQDRLENVMELVSLAKKFDSFPPEVALSEFLDEVSLVSDEESMKEKSFGVSLMTVHSSKGLEFDTVFIVGMETDLFPHKRLGEGKKTKEEQEEERRLFYVALTRARKKIYLSYSEIRTIFGERKINTPSEFIYDIPNDFLDYEKKSLMTKKYNNDYHNIDF